MCDWLKRLLQPKHPEPPKQDPVRSAEDWMMETTNPTIYRRSGPSAPPSEKSEPLRVRGRRWVDTSEERWEVPLEEEESSELRLEDLVKQLARVDNRDLRRSAAESLGQLGAEAGPAIPALLKAATDVDATVRKAASEALEAIDPSWPQNPGARKAIPDLLAALQSGFSEVHRAAFRLLRVIGPLAVPDLADVLLDGEDTTNKIHVMRLLRQIGPCAEDAVPGLTRALGSQFVQVRIAAARALAKIGPPPADTIPVLVAGLADPYADAREAMATCLACAGAAAEPAVPALLPLLADRKRRVCRAAEKALENIGPSVVPALIELVQTRDVQRLKAWIESLVTVSRWFKPRQLDMALAEPEQVWRNLSWTAYDILEERACLEAAQEAALRVLGKLGPAASEAVPAVVQAMVDPNPRIRLAAIRALGQIGPEAESAIPELIQMLVPSAPSFGEAVANALASIDSNWTSHPAVPVIAETLAGHLSDPGAPGEFAVDMLSMIGAPAVPALIGALESPNRVARQNAAKALGRIGAKAEAAIPALTQALQDVHGWVREEAARALADIERSALCAPGPGSRDKLSIVDQSSDPPTEATIQELLHEIAPGSTLLAIEPLPGSYSNYAHLVDARSADGSELRLVVRRYRVFGSYDREEKAHREFKTFALLQQHGIPCPPPLYLDPQGAVLGIPGIVTGYVPGTQIPSPSDPVGWARALAVMLARIHAVPCDAATQSFLLDADAEATWFLRAGAVPDYMAAHPDGAAVWQQVHDLSPNRQPVEPALVHIDYWPGNVLWHQGQIVAIVDWEEAAYGDPAIDVAYCRMELCLSGMGPVADEFLATYEASVGQPVANLGFWELAAAARPMFHAEGRITKSPTREEFRSFIATASRKAGE
jgi:HEAT repeat protein/aminoglycoside phosphotransferase (APT) family kinase protein